MDYFDLEIAKVKQILNGKFVSESDKQVWIDKLNDLERRKATSIENEKYFKSMSKYDRL